MDMKKRPANLKYGIWEEYRPSFLRRWVFSSVFNYVCIGMLLGAVLAYAFLFILDNAQ